MKRLFSTSYSTRSISWAALLLRVVFGGLLMHYGYYKLMHFGELAPIFADPFHFGKTPSLILVIFAEFFCSILVVIGLFTRLACIPPIVALSVVVFQVNHAQLTGKGDNATLFLAGFLVLLLTGPGRISMDKLIGK